jgi:hypothetical protein
MLTHAEDAISDPAAAFYLDALTRLEKAGIPFLIGGAFAFSRYANIERETKDLDVFVRPDDCRRALALLRHAGYRTELPFPHWLGKVHGGDYFIDVIFSSGNGVARVDSSWFTHAVDAEIFGVAVRVCPAEEMIWSKAFVQERERFDGADVLHLFLSRGASLDWERILVRFGDHWRVLLGHVVLFGYVFPNQRQQVPTWVSDELIGRLASDKTEPDNPVCYGTLLSREQYLVDLSRGYRDARLAEGHMTEEEVEIWTRAIGGG